MNNLIKMLLVMSVLSSSQLALASNDKIGSLRKVVGDNTINRMGKELKAIDGFAIFQNDEISTKADGSLGIIFNDNSRISLGSNSKLKVTKFIFNPSKKKFSMLTKMLKGSASFASGKMSKLAPDAVRIETPNATIGSRGTTFLIKVD